jgi:hypothetical protein
VSRRSFVGFALATGAGWLTLPDLLRARVAASPATRKNTSVIQIWLGGAASHIETYAPKPDAPSDFRGPKGK